MMLVFRVQALPSSQFTNPSPSVNSNWSARNDVDSACTNNTTTKPFTNLDYFHHFEWNNRSWLSLNNSLILQLHRKEHWDSRDGVSEALLHWTESRWVRNNWRQYFGMSKNVAGPTCYDIKQFQFLKHGTLPMIVTFLVQLVEMSETVRKCFLHIIVVKDKK